MSSIEAGKRLRSVRKDLLQISSSYTMSEEMGIPQSTYISYELGKMDITGSFLAKLYEKYSILPSYIVLGKTPIKDVPDGKVDLKTEMKQIKSQLLTLIAQVDLLNSKK
jgi:transcriptional regulator with XRE-family HTH domain